MILQIFKKIPARLLVGPPVLAVGHGQEQTGCSTFLYLPIKCVYFGGSFNRFARNETGEVA